MTTLTDGAGLEVVGWKVVGRGAGREAAHGRKVHPALREGASGRAGQHRWEGAVRRRCTRRRRGHTGPRPRHAARCDWWWRAGQRRGARKSTRAQRIETHAGGDEEAVAVEAPGTRGARLNRVLELGGGVDAQRRRVALRSARARTQGQAPPPSLRITRCVTAPEWVAPRRVERKGKGREGKGRSRAEAIEPRTRSDVSVRTKK